MPEAPRKQAKPKADPVRSLDHLLDPATETHPVLRAWKQARAGRFSLFNAYYGELVDLAAMLAALDRWDEIEEFAAWARRQGRWHARWRGSVASCFLSLAARHARRTGRETEASKWMMPLRKEWTNAKSRPSCYGLSTSLDALLARRTLNEIPYFVGSLFVTELSFLESKPPGRPGDAPPATIERLIEKAIRVVRRRLDRPAIRGTRANPHIDDPSGAQ